MAGFNPWARRRARRLLVQALYQWQVSANDFATVRAHCESETSFRRIDSEYFDAVLGGVMRGHAQLDEHLAPLLDREVKSLDQVERAILRMGAFELAERIEVPFRVVIDESVQLARTFGAEDSWKYINGVLDALARQLRAAEVEHAGAH